MAASAASRGTSGRILEVAERFAQTRGFNAFSYADLAAALHLTKATLHYHFPTKARLGERLIEHYETGFFAVLAAIDAEHADARAKLKAYVAIYDRVLARDQLCLCGMLAADQATLPEEMKAGVKGFFDKNDAWLSTVLAEGRNVGTLAFQGSALDAARTIISGLEGAMLISRARGDRASFRAVADRLLASIGAEETESARFGAAPSFGGSL